MPRPTTARAQSETVGVILLLGVFVITAGAVGVAVVGDVTSDTDEIVVSADLTADGTDLRVTHLGGDTVPNEDLAVVVRAEGNATRYPFDPPDGRFAPGNERTFSDALVANASNDVRLYHEPSGTQIERESFVPEPEPAAETGAIEGTVTGPAAASLRFASGGSFAVRQAAGPLSGATVAVDGAGRVGEARTGPGGTYRIDGLEPGEYEVSARAPGLSVSAATATVEANATTTVDFRLDPLRPAEFAVDIESVDATVDAGNPVTVDAIVENVGDEAGTKTVALRVDDETVGSTDLELGPGERRTVTLRWQTLPSDVGERTLTVDAGDDEATTTVEVLDAATDAVAYVDRDHDGDPDERYTAVELAFLGSADGDLVVYDDVAVGLPIGTTAEGNVTVRDGVTLRATGIDLRADGDVRIGGGARLDTVSGGILAAAAGDVTLRAGGDLDARNAAIDTSASAFFASAGDIDLTAGGDADLRDGAFEAVGTGWFSGDGRISVTAGGAVRTDGASFDPERE